MVKNDFSIKMLGTVGLMTLVILFMIFGAIVSHRRVRESFDSLCPYYDRIPGGLLDDGDYTPFPRAPPPRRTTGPPELDLCFDVVVRDREDRWADISSMRRAISTSDASMAASLGQEPPKAPVSLTARNALNNIVKNLTTDVKGKLPGVVAVTATPST
jgi:hypothetical protein